MPVMVRGETLAQQQPHSTSGDEWQVRFNTLSVEHDHPTDRLSSNAEDSDDGNEEQRLQSGPLLCVGRSAIPMGCGRPFDDDGRSLLPLSVSQMTVKLSTRRCSRGADANETNYQKLRLSEANRQCSTLRFVRQ